MDKETPSTPSTHPGGAQVDDELILRFSHAMRHRSGAGLRSVCTDMSRSQFTMLESIHRLMSAEDASGGVPVSQIARYAHMSMPACSRGLRALDDEGLIERRPDAADRRNTLVSLTEAGERRRSEIWTLYREFLTEVMERFGVDRTRALIAELDECRETMTEVFGAFHERHPELGDGPCVPPHHHHLPHLPHSHPHNRSGKGGRP